MHELISGSDENRLRNQHQSNGHRHASQKMPRNQRLSSSQSNLDPRR